MLAAPLRRYVGNGTLQDLQQRLLHPFPADVAGDGGVFALAGDLVNLVDIDDPPLRLGNVKIRRLQQPQQDIFHIFADIACFRQCSGVGDGKRYPQHLGQRLRQHGLSHAGGAQQQDIALAQLYIVCIPAANPLVVVVYRHRKRPFGRLLSDNILIQKGLDLGRMRNIQRLPLLFRLHRPGGRDILILQHGAADFHALVADADAGAGDQTGHPVLRFAAKGASHHFFVLIICHD